MNTNTLYAQLYRPLVKRLRRRGLQPVGRGGWRGRWRSFQTGYPGAVYAVEVERDSGKTSVFLQLTGTSRQQRYRALLRHREEIDGKLPGAVWGPEAGAYWYCCVALERSRTVSLTAPDEELEAARQWLAENLIRLKITLHPYLDRMMRDDQ